ncbi:MAG: hypothetical protein AABX47_00335 [Nanoarchaeota archaeon]
MTEDNNPNTGSKLEETYLIRQCSTCKNVNLYVKSSSQAQGGRNNSQWVSELLLPSMGYAIYTAAKKKRPGNIIKGITHGICRPCLEHELELNSGEE